MDWMTFFSNAIHDLAWPVIFIFSVFMLKKHGLVFAEIIEKLKYGDLEVTLRKRELEEASVLAEGIEPEQVIEESSPQSTENSETLLFITRPDLEIIDVWNSLEKDILSLPQSKGQMRQINLSDIMRHLVNANQLTSEELALFDRLRSIRNRVVHGRSVNDITRSEAADYRRLVGVLRRRLSQIDNPF